VVAAPRSRSRPAYSTTMPDASYETAENLAGLEGDVDPPQGFGEVDAIALTLMGPRWTGGRNLDLDEQIENLRSSSLCD